MIGEKGFMAQQRYISSELTHFVGRGKVEEAQYCLLIEVLRSGWLTHPPHDQTVFSRLRVVADAKFSSGGMYVPDVVCFCDIPLLDLPIHMSKYSRFGLSFEKSFLVAKGANPVFYVATDALANKSILPALYGRPVYDPSNDISKGYSYAEILDLLMAEWAKVSGRIHEQFGNRDIPKEVSDTLGRAHVLHVEMGHLFWLLKPFNAQKYEYDPENYYMEREWRILGNLRFELSDVYRVILPGSYGQRLRDDLPGYYGQITYSP